MSNKRHRPDRPPNRAKRRAMKFLVPNIQRVLSEVVKHFDHDPNEPIFCSYLKPRKMRGQFIDIVPGKGKVGQVEVTYTERHGSP
jgi:hypothetical protein